MLLWLMLLFVTMPLVELWLLIRIAGVIDLGPTILLVVVTGVVGASLARRQGLRTWLRVQHDLAAGRMPGSEIVDALLILVAGVMLITPGLVTDSLGFALLVPPIRGFLKRRVADRFRSRIVVMNSGVVAGSGFIDVEPTDARDVDSRSD